MRKAIPILILLAAVALLNGCSAFGTKAPAAPGRKFAVILQAGKESHEGMARAVHALLYASELKEKGYDVVLIFDGAGTEWAEELSNPDSQSKLLPMYKAFKEGGIEEVICDFCAGAFKVKEQLRIRELLLLSEYKGHPSIEKWIRRGYELLIL